MKIHLNPIDISMFVKYFHKSQSKSLLSLPNNQLHLTSNQTEQNSFPVSRFHPRILLDSGKSPNGKVVKNQVSYISLQCNALTHFYIPTAVLFGKSRKKII